MSKLTMTAMRNASLRSALRREYEAARKAGRRESDAELLRRAVNSPAGGYFVGMDHAIDMMRLHDRGALPAHMSGLRRQMWTEIAAKVSARRKDTGCNTTEAIAHVLATSTASRHFVGEDSARRITADIRKEARR